MNRKQVMAIFASAGMTFSGPLTTEALAMARSLMANGTNAMPQLTIKLGVTQTGKGATSNKGDGFGGSGPGNGGNVKLKGNAKVSYGG